MKFEWDDAENQTNIAKHGLSFEEATLAFADENCKVYPDILHSDSEQREICLWKVNKSIMTVVFTKRKGAARIISVGYYWKGKKLYGKS